MSRARLASAAAAVLTLACGAVSAAPHAAAPAATLLAAGDIASCTSTGDEATAALLDGLRGTVAALGDTVYEGGAGEEYARCYAPTWGRHRARTRPALGNHEYYTPRADGYFAYFGARAGPRRGYYVYRLGTWTVIVLNTNCAAAGGCEEGSPQERWLRRTLALRRTRCALAYGHHPRWSSGYHGSTELIAPLWRALHRGGVEIYLAGHDHHYERFAPLDAGGTVDRRRGVRQFVVGTGGRSHYPTRVPLPASEAADAATYGVLALRLRASTYSWRFVPVAGARFRDTGSGRCH